MRFLSCIYKVHLNSLEITYNTMFIAEKLFPFDKKMRVYYCDQ